MNHYELSINLLTHRAIYNSAEYSEDTTKIYFRDSLTEIDKYFKNSEWNPYYLFSSMGYYNEGKIELMEYNYNEGDSLMTPYAVELMEFWTKRQINELSQLSFTQMLLSKANFNQHYKLLLYCADNVVNDNNQIPNLITFDLNQTKWKFKKSVENFQKVDFLNYDYGINIVEQMDTINGSDLFKNVLPNPDKKDVSECNELVSIYLELGKCIVGNKYFYFVKPHAFNEEFNGVFLLGLKRELSPDELNTWVDKIHRILSEIAIKKIKEGKKEYGQLAFKAGISNATYSLGHFLKNRLVNSRKYIESHINNCKISNNKDIVEILISAKIDLLHGENTGKLLNILSMLKQDEDGKSVFLKIDKPDYINTTSSYKLFNGINGVIDYLKSKGWEINANGINKVKDHEIYKIDETSQEDIIRPKSFFYNEILFEVFFNACNHSIFEDSAEKYRKISVEIDEKTENFYVKNQISESQFDIMKANLNQANNDWREFFRSPGIYNYCQLLKLTKTGNMMARVSKTGKEYYFEVLIEFTGIKKIKNERVESQN